MNSLRNLPLPYFAAGKVVNGFKRGSKELGIPTANLSAEVVNNLPPSLECGIYYGWASLPNLNPPSSIYKSVISIGWNPFYKNTKKSLEVHIINQFEEDFYDELLKVAITGYLREEKSFSSVDDLIAAIQGDIAQAKELLEQPQMVYLKSHPFFTGDNGQEHGL